MINFTGQTSKRVVNLGNRRSGTTSKEYLERTRLQRQQRDAQRQKESATLVVQSHIRRYLDLGQKARQFRPEWLEGYGKWQEYQQWAAWVLKFLFLARFLLQNETPQEAYETLGTFVQATKDAPFPLTGRLLELAVSGLNIGLGVLNRISAPEKAIGSVCGSLLQLLTPQTDALPQTIPSKNILANLSNALAKEGVSEQTRLIGLELALALANTDSYPSILEFFSLSHIVAVPNRKQLEAIHKVIRELATSLALLLDLQKVSLLENVLVLHGKDSDFSFCDHICIGSILATMTFTIRNRKEVVDSAVRPQNTMVVTDHTYENVQVLCSSAYVKLAFNHFMRDSAGNDLSDLALQTFASLMYLLPTSKSMLCMLITITPGSYRWFYTQLKENVLYKAFEVSTSNGFLSAADLSDLLREVPETNQASFWNLLLTFEELYSYWLIVSNDLEIFSTEKLSAHEVTDLMLFLRSLCLTMIFNSSKSSLFGGYDQLKDVSISLLNQLHIKNIRLEFLPDNFWSPLDISTKVNNMINYIITEESNDDDIDYGENDDGEEATMEYSNSTEVSFKTTPSGPKAHANSDILSRIEVLRKLPFLIAFKERVHIFQDLITYEKENFPVTQQMFSFFDHENQRNQTVEIRREFILEDAFEKFHRGGQRLKDRLRVTFINKQGVVEDGIDGGGITKEFLTSVVHEAFRPDNKLRLFKETTSGNQLYPNEEVCFKLAKGVDVNEQELKLKYYRFLGLVVGKCLYDNVLIDVSFAPFFLIKCCNPSSAMKNSINDLNSLDKELFSNLMKLIDMAPSDIEMLDLNFMIDEKVGDSNFSFDLAPPNGAAVQVTASNRLNYIHLMSNFKLNQSLQVQTKYFLEGLFEIINPNWLRMFASSELQMLISGGQYDVNIQDWKENVVYGGYFDDDQTVVYFWQVVEEMLPEERFKLIKFVTSVSRAPLLGFGSLVPKFGIRNAGKYIDRLPTASTCINLLKLPDYKDKELLRNKILYAINLGSGFDLS